MPMFYLLSFILSLSFCFPIDILYKETKTAKLNGAFIHIFELLKTELKNNHLWGIRYFVHFSILDLRLLFILSCKFSINMYIQIFLKSGFYMCEWPRVKKIFLWFLDVLVHLNCYYVILFQKSNLFVFSVDIFSKYTL